jgi:hypothetical protein
MFDLVGVGGTSSVNLLLLSGTTIKATPSTSFCSDSESNSLKLIARADSCAAIAANTQRKPHFPWSFTIWTTFSVRQSNV